MIIGGLHKNSLIDYPGKLSCVLFLSGCNFCCPYCQNPELAQGILPAIYQVKDILTFLEGRKDFIEGIVLSGGEPTLQSGLFSLCRSIKKLGFFIKLDTNGSIPRVLSALIREELVDYVAMDFKTDPYQYSSLSQEVCNPQDILESIQIIQSSNLPYEFRTTCVKPFVSKEMMDRMIVHIEGAMLYALQRFNSETVLDPDFFGNRMAEFDEEEIMILKSIAEPKVEKCIIR